jgi:2',3'-cyclic-nucleotide 2'-phosphodiesterase/3'-nucleotidase
MPSSPPPPPPRLGTPRRQGKGRLSLLCPRGGKYNPNGYQVNTLRAYLLARANPALNFRRVSQPEAPVPFQSPYPFIPSPDQTHVRIMATTDLHAQILPYDYFADRPMEPLGLGGAATLIAKLRARSANTLLFDNGDFLQGSPLGDYIAEVQGLVDGTAHPMIAAMNALDYDAATLGNHEFNYGLDFLRRSIKGARFPFVCANAVLQKGRTPQGDLPLCPPFILLDRQVTDGAGRLYPLRIGVIGLLPPQITIWDATHLRGRLQTRDIVRTAQHFIPLMRKAGADLVVALCHSGIGSPGHRPETENAATALASVPGIDALILGHSHLVFPSPDFATIPRADIPFGLLCGKPAVMAGRFGSHLGVIDLMLNRSPSGCWTVGQARAEAVGVPPGESAASRAVCAVVTSAHKATLRHIRRRIGRTTVPLNSFFAVLPGNAALNLVAQAQRHHVVQALRATRHADLPVLSAVSPFKMGGRGGADFYTDIPAGDLAIRNIADLYVFPNLICAMQVTGADLAQWLERSAAMFNRLTPGVRDQMLLNPAMPATEFDVIHGMSWAVDLAQPARFAPEGQLIDAAAARITDLQHQGRPVRPDDRFIIATNSYRASSGSAFPGATDGHVIFRETLTNRDVLQRYVEEWGTVTPETQPHWRFLPIPGTAALFQTAARAAMHLEALRGLDVEAVGPGPAGYGRFRLHL